MKRSADRMSGGQGEKIFRRQNPISCRFCRNKKLRCDRAQPCSNCAARGIVCVSAVENTLPLVDQNLSCDSRGQSNTNDIESRLKALEKAVFESACGRSQSPGLTRPNNGPPLNIAISVCSDGAEHDSRNVATVSNGGMFSQDGQDEVRISNAPTELSSGSPYAPSSSSSRIDSRMPRRAIAEFLFNHYTNNLNWICHIIHVPTVRRQLAEVYAALEADQTPETSHLALIATILSISVCFIPKTFQDPIELQAWQLSSQSGKIWATLAQDALLEADHQNLPSIETLQATILMKTLLPNQVQDTSFVGALIRSTHMLQIHQVDSIRNRRMRQDGDHDAAELEVKRRIWWYLATTDWLLAFMSGPQCGTYMIHPDQMNVLMPSNADDEELSSSEAPNHPMSEPTEMTSVICRVQFAKAVRELVDGACKSGIEVEDLSYEEVLAFDRKLNKFLDEAPWFYRLDEVSRRKSEHCEKERPYIIWQRTFFHFGYHTRLCRLHRPYLARGYKDPRYAYSRMMCLRSARMVIRMGQKMHEWAIEYNSDCGRWWIVIHHIFVATMILVMDYCSHRDDIQAPERKQEILNCYKVLERSQEDSAIAKRGLANLEQVMNDWMRKSESSAEKPGIVYYSARFSEPLRQRTGSCLLEGIRPPSYRTQQTAAYSDGNWIGPDVEQNLWMDPFDFGDMHSDPQWEVLFRDLESQPGI